ncbi:MAG: TolB family protein [Melioribacteraceae bacterium]
MKDKLIILFLSTLSLFIGSCHNATEPDDGVILTGKIVFSASTNTNDTTAIYTINPDGTDLTKLTTSPYSDRPIWSPDGTQIAFIARSTVSSNTAIYIMNADGSNLHILPVQPQSLADGRSPAWSPDGSKIVYNHMDGLNSYIVIVSLTDGKVLNFKNSNNTIKDFSPKWSPDGKKIAFLSNREYTNDTRNLTDLYIMDSDGNNVKRLTELGGIFSYLWYPPDESIILSQNFIPGDIFIGKIYKIDTTGNIGIIYGLSASFGMAVTNDGKHLIFSHRGQLTLLDIPNVANVRDLYLNNSIDFRFVPIEWSQNDVTLLIISSSRDSKHSYLELVNIFAKKENLISKRIIQDDNIRSADWHK